MKKCHRGDPYIWKLVIFSYDENLAFVSSFLMDWRLASIVDDVSLGQWYHLIYSLWNRETLFHLIMNINITGIANNDERIRNLFFNPIMNSQIFWNFAIVMHLTFSIAESTKFVEYFYSSKIMLLHVGSGFFWFHLQRLYRHALSCYKVCCILHVRDITYCWESGYFW